MKEGEAGRINRIVFPHKAVCRLSFLLGNWSSKNRQLCQSHCSLSPRGARLVPTSGALQLICFVLPKKPLLLSSLTNLFVRNGHSEWSGALLPCWGQTIAAFSENNLHDDFQFAHCLGHPPETTIYKNGLSKKICFFCSRENKNKFGQI